MSTRAQFRAVVESRLENAEGVFSLRIVEFSAPKHYPRDDLALEAIRANRDQGFESRGIIGIARYRP